MSSQHWFGGYPVLVPGSEHVYMFPGYFPSSAGPSIPGFNVEHAPSNRGRSTHSSTDPRPAGSIGTEPSLKNRVNPPPLHHPDE